MSTSAALPQTASSSELSSTSTVSWAYDPTPPRSPSTQPLHTLHSGFVMHTSSHQFPSLGTLIHRGGSYLVVISVEHDQISWIISDWHKGKQAPKPKWTQRPLSSEFKMSMGKQCERHWTNVLEKRSINSWYWGPNRCAISCLSDFLRLSCPSIPPQALLFSVAYLSFLHLFV